jgi:hypothetical protein
MSATTTDPARSWPTRAAGQTLSFRKLALLVAGSRLIVWLAGAAGGEWGGRVPGWRSIDPAGITESFGHLGNLLLASAIRWDALAYLSIARDGYRSSTTVFYPGYPAAMAGLGWLISSDVAAGLLISLSCFTVGLWLLHRLTERELNRQAADATILLLAFAPLSLFFTALYTESLFFALSVGAIYAARRERWWQAGLLTALASVTRVTGILLLVPVGLWQLHRYRRVHPQMAWLLAAPAALAAFMVYLHADGFAWLAPFRREQASRHFGGPWGTLVDALNAFSHGLSTTIGGTAPLSPSIAGPFSPGFESIILLAVLTLAVAALVVVFRRLPFGYGAYAFLALLVIIASETRIQPLYGVDRYMLTVFPLWMAAGACLSGHRVLWSVLLVGATLLTFYSFEFATWAYVA